MRGESGAPKVGDRVLVDGDEFEVRAIIAEENSMILAETGRGGRTPGLWVLRQAELVRLAPGRWEATEYRSFEEANHTRTEDR